MQLGYRENAIWRTMVTKLFGVEKVGKCGLTFCSKLAARQFAAAGLLSPTQFFGMIAGWQRCFLMPSV